MAGRHSQRVQPAKATITSKLSRRMAKCMVSVTEQQRKLPMHHCVHLSTNMTQFAEESCQTKHHICMSFQKTGVDLIQSEDLDIKNFY